jgi:hypothetical protein
MHCCGVIWADAMLGKAASKAMAKKKTRTPKIFFVFIFDEKLFHAHYTIKTAPKRKPPCVGGLLIKFVYELRSPSCR